jgi:hypothetical protein
MIDDRLVGTPQKNCSFVLQLNDTVALQDVCYLVFKKSRINGMSCKSFPADKIIFIDAAPSTYLFSSGG